MTNQPTSASPQHVDEQAFYESVDRLHAAPLWRLHAGSEPRVREVPHVWRWDEVSPRLFESASVTGVGTDAAERRVLTFRNPGIPAPGLGATHTLGASLQLLLPGESAPPHRHTFSALRFVLAGVGASTVVDGERLPMRVGDLILTPGQAWHDHHHDGAEPIIWLDGIDSPFVIGMRAGFYEEHPDRDGQVVLAPSGDAPFDPLAVAALVPIDDTAPFGIGRGARPVGRCQPLRYPWVEAHTRVEALARATRRPAELEYRNAITGGSALTTIACSLHYIPPRERTERRRETPSSVWVVASGAGRATIGGEGYDLGTRDVVAVPSWTAHTFAAGDDPLVLFRMSDRPIVAAFGLDRTEWLPHG